MAESREAPFAKSPDGFVLNATPDVPDIRDRPYQPALVQLRPSIDPPVTPFVRDQGRDGACAGFALAAVIDLLNDRRNCSLRVSARMLYEMARRFDEWPGEDYSGSSCRGAIRGWRNMGVCSEESWPYEQRDGSTLTPQRALEARANTVGAYYRVGREIADYHAALNESGALLVSADVHEGWSTDAVRDGEIPYSRQRSMGGHAFAVVGYDARGFWVQNSWGRRWGRNGVALWSYEDWYENARDAWVVRLALPTPQIFGLPPGRSRPPGEAPQGLFQRKPARAEIAGHFVHIDDGRFHDNGRYWSNEVDVAETANRLAESDGYDHLLLYAHGGLNSIADSARRVSAMKHVFKANRIYPYHFMYDTGLMEEIKDVVLGKEDVARDRVGGVTEWTDKYVEYLTRRPGRALWREMKRGAKIPFDPDGDGVKVIRLFLEALGRRGDRPIQLHVAGHSTGGILMAHLIDALAKIGAAPPVVSCNLFAPACDVDLFNERYRPHLRADAAGFRIERMQVFSLDEELELSDNVVQLYQKSLLYLVSNAFEEEEKVPILGMKLFSKTLDGASAALQFIYSDGGSREQRTTSTSHAGFDNDANTLNSVLRTVLGREPDRPFAKTDLEY